MKKWHFFGIISLFWGCVSSGFALEPVTLQLKWRHAFQFAGYYAAKEKGFYRQAGLDVQIKEARPELDVVSEVVQGKAQFGVGSSSLLLERKAGKPVVVLAAIFQHSPLVILSPYKNASQGVHALVDQRIMFEKQSEELQAYLIQEGIPLNRIQKQAHSFNLHDLIDGKTDALSAYSTNETYFLERLKFPYQIYTPRSSGIDFYGDNLFTSERFLEQSPDQVKAFREASLKGWNYALAHPEEIAELIFKHYSYHYPLDFYLYEAKKMMPLIRPDLIEVGYMNIGRWKHIAQVYSDLGLLPRDFSLKGFIYQIDIKKELTDLYGYLFFALCMIVLMSGVGVYVYQVNQTLKRTLKEREEIEDQMKRMAYYDPLTHLPNRLFFFEQVHTALAEANTKQHSVGLMFLDLDFFKQVNDQYGHAVGDTLLQQAAKRMEKAVRPQDIVGRIGGDEFVVLCPALHTQEDISEIATHLNKTLSEPFEVEGATLNISSSIGIALYPHHAKTVLDLSKAADIAMYVAKEKGRNQFQFSQEG